MWFRIKEEKVDEVIFMSHFIYRQENNLLKCIAEELPGLVQRCFIMGSRSIAHKFARLLALCME